MTITLSKQYNFKLNEATMEQARNIIKEKGMTMTDAISLFVEQIVLEQDLPIKTAEDLYREQLIEELQAQSERALLQKRSRKLSTIYTAIYLQYFYPLNPPKILWLKS